MFTFLFALSLTSSALAKSDTLNVFLIPHSHCDPGWLETYEGYHTRFVERILTGVMESLSRSPDRRFVWAEISYFSRWFDTKNMAVKQQVRKFVENGQLEFVEGGWVQPDEANTNFDILVNQLTEGHDYLLKNFGVRPRFAWQIDPFGHSSLTPTLAAAVGFDALVINRIHHNLKAYFKQTGHMEFVWQGSASLGEESEIFTHVLHTHYSAPLGFDFEEGNVSPVGSNVRGRAEQLVRELKGRSEAYRTPNLLVTFGDDFKFQRAEHQFSNMDLLVDEINKGNYGVKIKYATLSEYFDAVFAAKADFPLYKGDFFPYADNSDSYWTGYYTTRPHLKGLTRRATSILHSAETAYAIARTQEATRHLPTFWDSQYRDILQGRRDTALVQHHDGITGTAKPHVADDYTNRLNRAVSASHQIIADMVKHLLYNSEQEPNKLEDVSFGVYDAQDRLFNLASSEDEYPLVYHNSLGWTRQQYVQVKVSASDAAQLRVYDADGNAVPCQTSPYTQNPARPGSDGSVFFLNFMAEVPPLGMSTYFVRRVTATASTEAPFTHQAQYFTHSQLAGASSKALRIENEFLQLTLSPETGLPERLLNKLTKQEITLHQSYAEYHTARSGAYIFRPAGLYSSNFQAQVAIVTGDLMSEITVFLGGNRHLILRLYTAPRDPLDYPEIGGVLFTTHQVNADGNREVVVRYTTNIDSGDSFYTDNGLELQLRSRNGNQVRSRAHIEESRAGAQETQYYPSISIAALRQPDLNLQLTVVSSQAMGTTSFTNGGLEVMLHRHLSQDDGRGLGEGVRDTNVIKVQQWLMLGRVADAELHRRRLSLQQDHPLTPLALDKSPEGFEWSRHFVNSFRPLTRSLPPNVHLLSLKARDAVSPEVALRLVHIAEGVDSVASPEKALPDSFQWETSIKLDDLFGGPADDDDKDNNKNGWTIAHPRPRSLTLNYDADEVEQRVRYDSSLGMLSMKIDFNRLARGGSQNTNEEGVFLSQAALDKMERERANQRQPLAIAHDGDDEEDTGARPELVDDAQVYRERSVRLRGEQRRVFDPTSVSVEAARQRQRRLLAVGRNEDPLTMVLRPLQMKSLLVVLASRGVQVLMGDDGRDNGVGDGDGDVGEKRPVGVIVNEEAEVDEPFVKEDNHDDAKDNTNKDSANKDSDEEVMKSIVKAKEAEKRRAEEQRREKEREQREKEKEQREREEEEEEERKRRERAEEERRTRERQRDAEADSEAIEVSERKAEASPQLPRTQADVLAEEQRFLSTGLEGERMMMMFLTIVIISLMIAVYLSFHRRHASAIISVSSLAAAAYPWSGSSSSSVASPAGKDFYRREMDQRLYSKMV